MLAHNAKGPLSDGRRFNRRKWSGRRIRTGGPPAPKPAGTSSGSPFLATLFLKTKDLSKDLVVRRCAYMCLRMRKVPRIFPTAKRQRMLAH